MLLFALFVVDQFVPGLRESLRKIPDLLLKRPFTGFVMDHAVVSN